MSIRQSREGGKLIRRILDGWYCTLVDYSRRMNLQRQTCSDTVPCDSELVHHPRGSPVPSAVCTKMWHQKPVMIIAGDWLLRLEEENGTVTEIKVYKVLRLCVQGQTWSSNDGSSTDDAKTRRQLGEAGLKT